MTKYNIIEKKHKDAVYTSLVSPRIIEDLKRGILDWIVGKKKYRDKNFSAQQLADLLHTNSRYISAVVNMHFHMNYTSFVNKYRVEEAMSMLTDPKKRKMNISDISKAVGFANRQSFYSAFYRINGCTPRDYRTRYFSAHPGAGETSRQAALKRRKAAREAAHQEKLAAMAEARLHPKKRGRPKKNSTPDGSTPRKTRKGRTPKDKK